MFSHTMSNRTILNHTRFNLIRFSHIFSHQKGKGLRLGWLLMLALILPGIGLAGGSLDSFQVEMLQQETTMAEEPAPSIFLSNLSKRKLEVADRQMYFARSAVNRYVLKPLAGDDYELQFSRKIDFDQPRYHVDLQAYDSTQQRITFTVEKMPARNLSDQLSATPPATTSAHQVLAKGYVQMSDRTIYLFDDIRQRYTKHQTIEMAELYAQRW